MVEPQKISGSCALVTGAAHRLGKSIALSLAKAGIDLILHYNSSVAEIEEVKAACLQAGVKAITLKANLAHEEEAQSLIPKAKSLFKAPTILINNASIFPSGTLNDLDFESLSLNLKINAYTPFILSKAFATGLTEGVIINLLDTKIVQYDRQHVAYHLSKRTLATLTRILALELAPAVRVNAVAPGLILPPVGKGEDFLAKLAAELPLKRHGSPQDISEAVLFLIKSDFITGQIIFVDGGQRLKGDFYAW